MAREFEAILFDFDGVLADSEPVHFACWKEVLAPLGIEVEWDHYAAACIGVADLAMVDALRRRAGSPVSLEAVWAQYPRKKELFRARVAAFPIIPAATAELVRSLDGYRLAVVSSSARGEVEPLIASAGLRHCFDAIVCGEDVARLKPAPDPYVEAARRLDVTRALVVEDSDAGEASGLAAGFEVLRIREAARTADIVRRRLALDETC